MLDDVAHRFAALVHPDREEVPLDEALLLVAAQACPEVDPARERARLDVLAAGVAERTPAGVVAHLVAEGFAGDRVSYHDARNSLLPEVLDRRLGIPLTLAVLAVEVGRRIGVGLEGVGMPGHFLLRGTGRPEELFDLFDGGTRLDDAGARALLAGLQPGLPWDPRFLDAVGPRAVLVRLLANLAGAHRRAGDRAGLAWCLRLRAALPDQPVAERRERAAVAASLGAFLEAAALLDELATPADRAAAARWRARCN